jgi:hypothetical protein
LSGYVEFWLQLIGVREVVRLTVEHTGDGCAVDMIDAGKNKAAELANNSGVGCQMKGSGRMPGYGHFAPLPASQGRFTSSGLLTRRSLAEANSMSHVAERDAESQGKHALRS